MDLRSVYQKFKPVIQPVLHLKNRLFSLRVKNHGRNNRITGLQQCRMKHVRIDFHGSDNLVEIGDMTTLSGLSIGISGSGNRITIGSRVSMVECGIWLEDDGNAVCIGDHSYLLNHTDLSAIEGTKITIGSDCLFSSDIRMRTGDSHSLLNAQGKRINPSADITIGNHVWVGFGAAVLKGAVVEDDCVVGTQALVTGKTPRRSGACLGGNPARILKTDISWDIRRLPIEASE